MIAPFYKQLSLKYPDAMFLKIDVDKCPGTAAANNVSAMPTFVFFRNRVELERIRGADKNQLENKVKQYYTAASDSSAEGGEGAGAGASAGLDGGLVGVIQEPTRLEELISNSEHRSARFRSIWQA